MDGSTHLLTGSDSPHAVSRNDSPLAWGTSGMSAAMEPMRPKPTPMYNNQAVVNALNGLQAKIKNLEQERNYYMELANKARQHLDSYKAENEMLRENERKQTELRERAKDDDLRRVLEDRPKLEMQAKQAEDKLAHTERLLKAEREEFHTRMAESARERDLLKDEVMSLQHRLVSVEQQLSSEQRLRKEADEGRVKANQAVVELIAVNATIFDQWQESTRATRAPPKIKKAPPRGRSASRQRSHSTGGDRQHLAHTISSSHRLHSPRGERVPALTAREATNNIHDRLRRINRAEIPFVPCGRQAADSFNQLARVQAGLDLAANVVKEESRRSPSKVRPEDLGFDEYYSRLSAEYDTLCKRYSEELEKMKTMGELGNLESGMVERLRSLQDEMQKKAEDMRFLYTYEQKMEEQLREASKPPFVRGMEKRTKTLELFDKLKKTIASAS